MKKRWDNWHKLVSDVIHERFANSVWQVCPHSPPLSCEISYVVARDGRVGNVRVLQPSTNVIFDNLAINIIRCIRMNPVLDFPSAAKRKFVQKTLTFTWEGSTVEAQPEKPQAVQILLGPCDFPPEDPPHIGPGQVCK
jgi:hypothetical protein